MMKKLFVYSTLVALCFGLSSCTGGEDPETLGMSMVSAVNLEEHIKFIAHDLTEGRDTGSRGEKIAHQYIASQFAINGVEPAGEDGTYFQNFELVQGGLKSIAEFTFAAEGRRYSPKLKTDFVAIPARPEKELTLDSEVVFVGYGIDAPEYNWNDYKDIDLNGKTVLVMLGEPTSDDSEIFKGEEKTEYADMNYKSRIAGEKGAAGVIIVYDPDHVRFSWKILANYAGRPRMQLKADKSQDSQLQILSFITGDCAIRIAKLAGKSPEFLKEEAESSEFKPIPMGLTWSVTVESEYKDIPVRNVVGLVRGKIADEYVLYTAHTDHMGIGRPVNGDNIYNGAIDDASGCAFLIELGRIFAALPSPPERSIIFACVTAEERGLLGSKYYAQNPVFPLNKTLAVINLDGMMPWGKARDFVFIGAERSSLGALAEEIAEDNGMTLTPDIMPEENFYRRSDHFSLAQEGLPGGMLINGFDFIDKPEGWGLEELKKWLKEIYHHPTDEYTEDWNMDTAVQVGQIAFQFGHRIAKLEEWPTWNDNQSFKKIREESLKQQ